MTLRDKLIGVEGNLLQLKLTGRGQDGTRWAPMLLQKISYLAAEVGSSSDFPPTTQQVAVQELLKQQGDKYQQDFQQLVSKDVAGFNAFLREKNIPNIIIKRPEPPARTDWLYLAGFGLSTAGDGCCNIPSPSKSLANGPSGPTESEPLGPKKGPR